MSGKADKSVDVTSLPAHPEPQSITVKEENISVVIDGKTLSIFSRHSSPKGSPKLTVLLLHGRAFTSKNWEDIGTLQRLASWGYQAVGVDLPGYGKSESVSLGDTSTSSFLLALVEKVGKKPVIVSPSMSGGFALPYLFEQPQESCHRAAAYIPVAPVMTESFQDKYPDSQIRTLVVYGSKDKTMGFTSRDHLKALPRSTIAVIPEAGHACYLDQPHIFHNLLYDFLGKVSAELK
ncbi:hypothetical protein ACOMHN_004667 [Nucella lapillus]